MKTQKFIGIARQVNGHFYLLPTLYLTLHNWKHEERHSASIELRIYLFGVGLRVEWINKKYEPIPEWPEGFSL